MVLLGIKLVAVETVTGAQGLGGRARDDGALVDSVGPVVCLTGGRDSEDALKGGEVSVGDVADRSVP